MFCAVSQESWDKAVVFPFTARDEHYPYILYIGKRRPAQESNAYENEGQPNTIAIAYILP
jgi:hypothetical protein